MGIKKIKKLAKECVEKRIYEPEKNPELSEGYYYGFIYGYQQAVEDKKLPDMDLEEAEKLSMKCDYACFANEDENEINTGDASAFFLEGYLEAKKRLLLKGN